MEYSRSDLYEWLQHPITRDLFRALMQHQQDIQEQWANGNFDSWERNLTEVGRYRGIQDVIDAVELIKESLPD